MATPELALRGGPPVRRAYLVFGSPDLRDEEIREVEAVLRSGWLGTGPRVARFEEAFREYIGARHAMALNSCTAGLHLSMIAVGVRPGDEVITCPMTFASSANAILHVGALPVFVDCERDSMCLDPAAVEARITPRTKALLPVHFAGRAADMTRLLEIARRRGIKVVEDAAHAIETVHRGRKVGTIADCTVFSFYVTKNVVTGEGGMVTTEDPGIADWIKVAGLHGLTRDAWKRFSDEGYRHYEVTFPGFKYNMMDLQAALGIHQLARVEENLRRREALWRRYRQAFAGLPLTVPPEPAEGDRHARHLFTILLDVERLGATRDQVLQALHAEGIGTGVHYRPLHLQQYYRERFGYRPGSFPNAEWIGERTLSLPFSTKLSDADAEDVIRAVRKVCTAAWG
ncbi:MAG: DegT/DnrJ/EryC1/StrS family aminotransferase [Candidatus Eisenbacteria bacterium]|uniref:DegT/DnrJ/EryC1/StrS family aminotransferase n=1 Tax=Eiseniibacteriota bacterium TaxID=2212470 RepID=A0A937XA99_UNCEI|nr:DegT/DnrJ/EryC1/StrS family aminotransferase [Candidatus Eisenbacteria bacterium]